MVHPCQCACAWQRGGERRNAIRLSQWWKWLFQRSHLTNGGKPHGVIWKTPRWTLTSHLWSSSPVLVVPRCALLCPRESFFQLSQNLIWKWCDLMDIFSGEPLSWWAIFDGGTWCGKNPKAVEGFFIWFFRKIQEQLLNRKLVLRFVDDKFLLSDLEAGPEQELQCYLTVDDWFFLPDDLGLWRKAMNLYFKPINLADSNFNRVHFGRFYGMVTLPWFIPSINIIVIVLK